MAVKQKFVPPSLQDALEELTQEKGLEVRVVQEAIEEAVAEAFRKQFDTEMAVTVKIRPDGSFRIFGGKTVVDQVADPFTEISSSDPAAKGYGLGDTVVVEITQEISALDGKRKKKKKGFSGEEFGRLAAMQAKQIIRQRIREAERRKTYEEYKGREGEMVHGKVQRIRRGNIIVDIGRTEALLPARDLMPRERFREGDRVKAVIRDVRLTARGAQIILSRTHPDFVRRLFEMEVTEVYDGTVEIKSLAREPGFRSKVAVFSRDAQVDPVGACVGQKGIRVQTIVKELGGEKIDIVYWDPEPTVFIRNALLPAEIERVVLKEDERIADVVVADDQLSLAIGREGQNARLAARLTEWTINIRGKSEMARETAQSLLEITFGSTPEEVLSRFGIGAETAPAFAAAGLGSLENLATAETAVLIELAGDAGVDIQKRVRKVWEEVQEEMRKMEGEYAPTFPIEEKPRKVVPPFVLPDGTGVGNIEELTAHLDAMPAEEVDRLLKNEDLHRWLQEMEYTPGEIGTLVERYR
ncbi:MAG: transcription termination/antitermination protein NusA [Candidatus Hydrogenedentota bacterium]|nr:MAG: transcription termination/antitermination protein NusA [Candidatus Hydrogenedentota bacterium]